jgi:hypothetical protein
MPTLQFYFIINLIFDLISGRVYDCDYAWLMIEALRRLGLACRFVSGYLYDAALDGGEVGMTGSGATHALSLRKGNRDEAGLSYNRARIDIMTQKPIENPRVKISNNEDLPTRCTPNHYCGYCSPVSRKIFNKTN